MFNLTFLTGSRIDASALDPGEKLVCFVLLGGLEVDFTACREPALHEVTVVSMLGGVNLKVRAEQPVRLDGFSLLGGRNVEPRQLPPPESDGEDELPLQVAAFALFGGINVERA